jgi:O-methyltransferase
MKTTIKNILLKLGFSLSRIPQGNKRDNLYRPFYCPWEKSGFDKYFLRALPNTLVSRERCYVLERLLRHTLTIDGDVVECGVYKGGTAALLSCILDETNTKKQLYLFDTFEGMPETDKKYDIHKKGDFSDTSLESVQQFLSNTTRCVYKKGFMPDTFSGLEAMAISFCHIDVDIYSSIIDSLNFIWPRLSRGGIIVFDNYGFPSCPGALYAVDSFFKNRPEIPLCLQTGQAIVIKI